jgi:lipoate-protein ligase A
MNWRIIPLETMDAFSAMAFDEACCEHVKGGGPPTIRFWKWQPSAVSIGYFQSIFDEVNIRKCEELGYHVVRRRTGGGAVFHDSKGEITYSVICPEEMVSKDITESYRIICSWIVKGLENLGIKSEFMPVNDIIVSGKKISGNAQTRRSGILHMHGTILHDLDAETMFSVLKVTNEKIADKMIQNVKERVTRVLDHNPSSMEGSYQALVKGFTHGKEWEEGSWSEDEQERAEELAETKYSSREWNFRR